MMSVLLKFSLKHKEFVEKLFDKKKTKERAKLQKARAAQKDLQKAIQKETISKEKERPAQK